MTRSNRPRSRGQSKPAETRKESASKDTSPPEMPLETGELFSDRGISFEHDRGFSVNCEEKPRERIVTVSSKASGFWSLMVFLDRPDPEEVLETVLDSFRDEFKDLDIYDAQEEICGQPALARDLGFFCYDLTNTAEIRVFQTDRLTALILCQATDDDWDDVMPRLHHITETLELDESQVSSDSFRLGDYEEGDDMPDDLEGRDDD